MFPLVIFGHHRLRDRFLRNTLLGYWVVSVYSLAWVQRPEPLPGLYVQALYQLLHDVHQVLENCGIPYWIEAGTLLGAVRHRGLIPWDDDIDIQVFDSSATMLAQKAIPLLQSMGYGFHSLPQEGGIKVHCTAEQIKLAPQEALPACDIFYAREKTKGNLFIWGCSASFSLVDLLPLKEYAFGPLKVWGPANPLPYLSRLYGKNWALMAKRGNDHFTNQRHTSHSYFLIHDFSPALPPLPLRNITRNSF